MMKRRLMYALFFVNLLAAAQEKGFHEFACPGYEGLDPIPGTAFTVHQKNRAQPERVLPSDSLGITEAPSDATVLFDGRSLDQFQETNWQVIEGVIVAGNNNLVTKDAFGDLQLHVEWCVPNPPSGKPNNMGNSGIFFMELYELQVFDSYSCKIYADGSAGAIYGQTPPLLNVCRKPGEWQSFDVVFTAPVFDGNSLLKPAYVTVFHNGILIHHHTQILGPTTHKKSTPYKTHSAKAPIYFQGHESPVQYRNIWIREL